MVKQYSWHCILHADGATNHETSTNIKIFVENSVICDLCDLFNLSIAPSIQLLYLYQSLSFILFNKNDNLKTNTTFLLFLFCFYLKFNSINRPHYWHNCFVHNVFKI